MLPALWRIAWYLAGVAVTAALVHRRSTPGPLLPRRGTRGAAGQGGRSRSYGKSRRWRKGNINPVIRSPRLAGWQR
jgi:hypothetical protein